MSPVDAIVRPAEVTSTAAKVTALAQRAGSTAGGQMAGPIINSLGPAAAPSWNCDLSSVAAIAGGIEQSAVNGAVNLAERAVGAERVALIRGFAARMGDKINHVTGLVRSSLSSATQDLGRWFSNKTRRITEPAADAAAWVRQRYAGLAQGLAAGVASAKASFQRNWSELKDSASRSIADAANWARTKLSNAAGTARGLLGGLGSAVMSMLPGWASSFVSSIPARVDSVVATVRGFGRSIAQAAAGARDTALGLAKSYLDNKLQEIAAARQAAEALVKGAADRSRAAGHWIASEIPESVKAPVRSLVDGARRQAGRFMSAADSVGAKIRDGSCVALGTVAGPCVTQYLPDLGGGLNNTVRVTAQADMTVPLEEVGVPANLKIGAGSSVAVSARDGLYVVAVSGNATIFLNETVGQEAHAEAGGTGAAPQLPAGALAPAWLALNGHPTTPALPAGAADSGATGAPGALAPSSATAAAPAGGAAAPTEDAAAGAGREIEVNAGIRGTTETEWHFNARAARTSCEGVGGLVTLLSGLGVAGVLPAPFNQLGAAAVQRGFMNEMTSSKFSAGLAGDVRVDLRTEGIGRLRGRLGGDVSENVQTVRDPLTGQLVTTRTRTITGELDTTALGPFTAGGLERFAVYLEGQGIVRLTLAYEDDAIVPTTVGAAIKTTVGARNFDPSVVATLFPPEVADDVRRLLEGALPGMQGPREVALSLTIGRTYTGLEPMGRELNAYFRGPVDQINVDGVVRIVKRNLPNVTPTNHAKLELSATQRRTLAAGATEGDGVAVGANASVEGEHTISREWYGFTGGDEVLEAASRRGRQARPEPVDPKKPGDGKPKPPGRMRSQIQQGDIHYGSAAKTAAKAEDGVTAKEFADCQAAALVDALLPRDRRRGKEQLPGRFVPPVQTGHAIQMAKIRTEIIPRGVSAGGEVRNLRVCFDPRSLAESNCRSNDVRLDVVNDFGENLKKEG